MKFFFPKSVRGIGGGSEEGREGGREGRTEKGEGKAGHRRNLDRSIINLGNGDIDGSRLTISSCKLMMITYLERAFELLLKRFFGEEENIRRVDSPIIYRV